MNLFDKESTILATCPKGLPPYLNRELRELGFGETKELFNGVLVKGTLKDCMRLNLHLFTAHRVLWEMAEVTAPDADTLYQAVTSLPWETVIAPDGYISVSAGVKNDTVNDSRYAAVRVKDAVADRMRRKTGSRPDSGPDKSRTCLHLHWLGDSAVIYLDSTGEPLPKRGYRRRPHKAPMQESLAAACLMAAHWPVKSAEGNHFIAPMCGSGTLAIEAALIGLNRAPGALRDNFGFMHLAGFDHELWKELRKQASASRKETLEGRIIATDRDPKAVEAARHNAMAAGVDHFIEFDVCDFSETEVPEGGPGLVMLNPEYGMRLGDEKRLEPVYAAIGDFFKKRCGGYWGYIFTGNLALGKKVGLRTARRIPFFNAKIECRLLEYELYAGTRKQRT